MATLRDKKITALCDEAEKSRKPEPATFWKLVKRFTNKRQAELPLCQDDRTAHTSEEKAELLRDTLESAHSVPQNPTFDSRHFDNVNTFIAENEQLFRPLHQVPPLSHDNPMTKPITLGELKAAIKTLRNTAPGHDGVSNRLLKKTPDAMLRHILSLFNASLAAGFLPTQFLHATVLMFPKPGKNHSSPDNYRPISLTCTLSKLLEKILCHRIHTHLNAEGIIPDTQAGFRPGVNTYEQILKVATAMEINVNKNVHGLIALMDVKKAFDTVWHAGLLFKLHSIGLPDTLVRWIASFLLNRTARVKQDDALSSAFVLRAGVPQGSTISPLLYLLYVLDAPNPGAHDSGNFHGQGLAQFADDTAYWAASQHPHFVCKKLNQTLSTYLAWCNKWRITLNADKTQLCYVSRTFKSLLKVKEYPITLGTTQLKIQHCATYLGIKLDSRMKYKSHILEAAAKAKKRVNILKVFNHGCSQATLAHIYTALIRPVLVWGHPLYATLGEKDLRPLELVERKALRTIYRAPLGCSNANLYAISSIPRLRDFVYTLNQRFTESMLESPFSTALHDVMLDLPPGKKPYTLVTLHDQLYPVPESDPDETDSDSDVTSSSDSDVTSSSSTEH